MAKDNLEEHPIVAELVGDPEKVPDLVTAYGYLGRGSGKGTWRLYLTADLSWYLEFPVDAVRLAAPAGKASDSLSGTVVWFLRDANIRLRRNPSAAMDAAAFLSGPMERVVPESPHTQWPRTKLPPCFTGGSVTWPKSFVTTICDQAQPFPRTFVIDTCQY